MWLSAKESAQMLYPAGGLPIEPFEEGGMI
jgi:hypothetical protein